MVRTTTTIRAVRVKIEPTIKKLVPKSVVSRYIRITTKRAVCKNQRNRCANAPESKRIAIGMCESTGNTKYYDCILWKYCGGKFDEAGCQYDHIREFSRASKESDGMDDVNGKDNIQALCHACHAVKTRAFAKCKREICGDDIVNGGELMAVDV